MRIIFIKHKGVPSVIVFVIYQLSPWKCLDGFQRNDIQHLPGTKTSTVGNLRTVSFIPEELNRFINKNSITVAIVLTFYLTQ